MEGFGLVCLEANLRGLPVFAANLEGITDAVQDQKNGYLLPTQDSTAWLAALDAINQAPDFVKNFGLQARKYVLENFGWEKMTASYFNHFRHQI